MSEETNIKERIYLLINALGTNARKFSLTVSSSDSFVRNIRDNIGSDKIRNILLNYPKVNAEWLIMGKGEMFKSQPSEPNKNNIPVRHFYQASEDPAIYKPIQKDQQDKIELQQKLINSLEETIRSQRETIEQLNKQLKTP